MCREPHEEQTKLYIFAFCNQVVRPVNFSLIADQTEYKV